MPLPRHTPIHPRFSEHNRPTATGTQTGHVTITRSGTGSGALNPDGSYTPPAASVIYSGPCRIAPRPASERVAVVGDQRVTIREYALAIEWDAAEVHVDDIATVDDATDPGLVGKRLRVSDVKYATEQWERILMAVEDLTRPAGG
jgi:hypothetical protein